MGRLVKNTGNAMSLEALRGTNKVNNAPRFSKTSQA
jgi:hypothetical protein